MKFKTFNPVETFQRSAGFTLIELLVTFSLISVISAVGFASFSSYSRRQIVFQAASDLKQVIDSARFGALSNVRPNEEICDTEDDALISYTVKFCISGNCSGVSGNNEYRVEVSCGTHDTVIIEKKLPDNVTFVAPESGNLCQDVTFNSVSSLISGSPPLPCGINLNGFEVSVPLLIDTSGYVSI